MKMSAKVNTLASPVITGLSAGLVIGLTELIFSISIGTLIFSGQTVNYMENGIGLILFGSIAPVLLVSLFSSYKGNMALPQDAPAAILAIMAAGILQSLDSAAPREKFITVAAVVAITSVMTGLAYILVGQFKLGSFIRFLPYPVIGGFLAGTGWLLVNGGIGVMSNLSFSFSDPGALFQPDLYLRWVPGLALAVVILLVLDRYDHFLILPGMLVGAALLFYGVAFVNGVSKSTLSAQGWLLGPFDSANLLPAMIFSDMGLIHWDAIFMEAGNIASIILISVVSLLLNSSGLELIVRKDIDLNHDLRITGIGNVLGGLTGGSVSYTAISTTALNHRIGNGSVLSGIVAAVIFMLPIFFGAGVLSYIPKALLGALLVFFGMSFLYEWVVKSWKRFSRLEYAIILLILIAIATIGYLQGVIVGILAAVVLFVVNYSRINVAKHTFSGADIQSRFTRNPDQRKILIAEGVKTFVLQLQGYIFFGTAHKLLEQVRKRAEDPGQPALLYLILDFAKVNGVDSTALLSFTKMKQVLQYRGISILVTGPSAAVLKQLEEGDFFAAETGAVALFPDLDHGLEWAESKLLSSREGDHGIFSLKDLFLRLLPDETRLSGLFKFLEKRTLDAGEYLIHQNDKPDNIYFVESGQVTARLEKPAQAPIRLETMRDGRIIGELGFYLGQNRTAAVIADEPSVIYLLSEENLAKMEKKAPDVASYFHKLVIRLMAERITHLIRTVTTLEK